MAETIHAPKWAKETDIKDMDAQAAGYVVDTREKSGPALTRSIEGIGAKAQKKLVQANTLMSSGLQNLLEGLDGKSPTGEKLAEMRVVMDEMNPGSLMNAWWFSWMPTSIKRRAVRKFASTFHSNQSNMTAIFDHLRDGKDDLLQLSISLEAQYEQVLDAKREAEREIYIAELFLQKLEDFEKTVSSGDILETNKIASVKNQAMRRLRDLRTKEHAAVQFFVSIDQSIQNNSLLNEHIDSALSVGPMVLYNAVQIASALQQQKAIKDQVKSFQDGLGDMMAQNAANIKQSTIDIAEMYNNPVIALEKMQAGFNDLVEATDMAQKAMCESTAKAREAADIQAQMTAELEPLAIAIRDARDEGIDAMTAPEQMTLENQTEEKS